MLRDKGLEEDEEVVPWDIVFELICCSSETAVPNEQNCYHYYAHANTMAVPNADSFVTGS